MIRQQQKYLKQWKDRRNRRPLIVRGARQVGKTWLVRSFGESEFENTVEYNFDLEPEKSKIFQSSDIQEIVNLISIDKNALIIPGKTLLFLDEIQAVPELIAKLRYFYELRPDLHVIAAGSLLDLTLSEYEYAMPVGRIEYLYMGPMTYEEFLIANKETGLLEALRDYSIEAPLHTVIHEKCLHYLNHYFFTGGMPGAVKAYINGDFNEVMSEHRTILQTFIDDFSKYRKRINTDRLKTVFNKIPQFIGKQIKYTNISRHEKAKDLNEALWLLSMANVVHMVYHSSSNGIPLKAEVNEKVFKVLFLDIGLVLSALNLTLLDITTAESTMLINNGALAEQFVGQHLVFQNQFYNVPELYYWTRRKTGATSELDYVIRHRNDIIPVEVKAGKTGALKSMQVFVSLKKPKLGVRFNMDLPTRIRTRTAVPGMESTPYTLLSLPLYMVDQWQTYTA